MKMDLTNMISNGTEETQVPEQKLTKEEYAAKKQQEREEVWAEVDSQAQGVFMVHTPELISAYHSILARLHKTPASEDVAVTAQPEKSRRYVNQS